MTNNNVNKISDVIIFINNFLSNLNVKTSYNNKKGVIYLIRLNDCMYKIGYTINVQARLKTFRCVCPSATIICRKNGTIIDEQKLHRELSDSRLGNSEVYSFLSDKIAINNFI